MLHPTFKSYFTNTSGPVNIDDLLAFHSKTFTGFKMEEGDETPPADAPPADAPPADAPPADAPPADEPPAPDDTKLSLEDALGALKAARDDAAKQRIKAKENAEALKNAKTPEEFEAARLKIVEDTAKENRDLLVELVATQHKLPAVLAARLQGETREQLEADAKALAQIVPDNLSEETDPTGGLDPDKGGDAFDARAEARAARRKRF